MTITTFEDGNSNGRMQLGLWYLCGDSGYLHCQQGFVSPAEAVVWWRMFGDEPTDKVYVPRYLPGQAGWEADEGAGERVMCLYADDVLQQQREEGISELELYIKQEG